MAEGTAESRQGQGPDLARFGIIREKFNAYRFADYKDKATDPIARVTRVSVETERIVKVMRSTAG